MLISDHLNISGNFISDSNNFENISEFCSKFLIMKNLGDMENK